MESRIYAHEGRGPRETRKQNAGELWGWGWDGWRDDLRVMGARVATRDWTRSSVAPCHGEGEAIAQLKREVVCGVSVSIARRVGGCGRRKQGG